jgi:hypothetical protein
MGEFQRTEILAGTALLASQPPCVKRDLEWPAKGHADPEKFIHSVHVMRKKISTDDAAKMLF